VNGDQELIACWWREILARPGTLPAGVQPVQSRLVRAVGTGTLPSGPVFLKVMGFPRWRDRLRYCWRALPAAHEARLLAGVHAAGIPCPEVVAVRTARRALLPFASLLVLRALPVARAPTVAVTPVALLRARATLARRLLAAGILHPDLHADNFVSLQDGRLAVLDLQSARRVGKLLANTATARIRVAARLFSTAPELDPGAVFATLCEVSLLGSPAAAVRAHARARRQQAAWWRSRLWRCLRTSTEFEASWRWRGVEYRRRGALPPGSWQHGDERLRRCWLGQRALQLFEGQPPQLFAYFRSWWWQPPAHAVYIPAELDPDQVGAELSRLAEGFDRYRELFHGVDAADCRVGRGNDGR